MAPTPPKTDDAPMDGFANEEIALSLELAQSAVGVSPEPHEKWYLVDCKWWEKYLTYLKSHVQADHPGSVDNSALFEPQDVGQLKKGLVESIDYSFVPENLWQSIVKTFGIAQGQQPCECTVIETGLFKKHARIEVYPLQLIVSLAKDAGGDQKKIAISRGESLDGLRQLLVRELGIDAKSTPADIRIYQKLDNNNYELLKLWDRTLYDIGLTDNRHLLLDVKQSNGEWNLKNAEATDTAAESSSLTVSTSGEASRGPSTSAAGVGKSSPVFGGSSLTNGSSVTRSGTQYGFGSSASSLSPGGRTSGVGTSGADALSTSAVNLRRGLTGLANLGNTCFMNSGLQCMSNSIDLTNYMLCGRWKEEINEANPLGMRGEMARAYAGLIDQLWSGKFGSIQPRHMKQTIGNFKDTFLGYQQQDSQELIIFLLDGLHEDLNRVKTKPYVEQKDVDNRPDKEVADEAWANYLRRNDSIIVDLFHGQIKSTVICPDCSKVSITFDPICYLSLPLPQKKERLLTVGFVGLQTKGVVVHKVLVAKNGLVSEIGDALAKQCGADADRLVFADLYQGKLYKILDSSSNISSIMERDDILAYELEHAKTADMVLVSVHHRCPEARMFGNTSMQLFGLPLVFSVERDNLKLDYLERLIKQTIEYCLEGPSATEKWWCKQAEVDGSDDEAMEDGDVDLSEQPPLFTLSITNNFTSTTVKDELKKLASLDRFLRTESFGEILSLAADWHSAARPFYNVDKAAERSDDASVQTTKLKQKTCQLADCFDLFTSLERLGAEDTWYCPNCKKHQQATKQLSLWRLPTILIIHLKRFNYTRYYRDKIESLVEFPLKELDLSNWLKSTDDADAKYDLVAVSNHMGGLGGGHYTAYAKNAVTKQFYEFDDSHVSGPIPEDRVISKSAYVLFYRKSKSAEGRFEQSVVEPMDTSSQES